MFKISKIFNVPKIECEVFDIDGVLADNNDAAKSVGLSSANKDIDWNKYYELLAFCKVNSWAKTIINNVETRVVIVTGREESNRAITEMWLKNNHIYYDHLFMRPVGNTERSHVVKKQIIEDLLKQFHIKRAYDDEKDNILMFNELGIECVPIYNIGRESV